MEDEGLTRRGERNCGVGESILLPTLRINVIAPDDQPIRKGEQNRDN
jgi:hypothetical protein